ncbi:MAG TPA: sigma-70 family RNA polymerase sigma factor [Vicinamibacterales bacterium]|nr:sigma-70 family RNA polymerase sigma factor [Vicinamibacterales bacterium]
MAAADQDGRPVGVADEAGLVAALCAGDAAAYEVLVRTHAARLTRVARHILRNEEDARDAVQDAFISAFRAIQSFDAGSRLSTWLHRIVVNACLMRLRTRRRKPEESLELLLPAFLEDGHHAGRFREWEDEIHGAIERRQRSALVRSCIDQLPDTYRTVLLLRDIEGLDGDETARMLGVTPNAVKIRLHRARQALRTLLDPHFKGGGQ